MDYVFSENGLVAFKDGKSLANQVCTHQIAIDAYQLTLSVLLPVCCMFI
jgi:hypothetical protein